jgi:hypothetical protein
MVVGGAVAMAVSDVVAVTSQGILAIEAAPALEPASWD